jgi:PIN domain nuclease of toxin-antitoxin system
MGHFLLDTHTAIWFFNEPEVLSKKAYDAICDVSNTKYLSMTSAWELAIKIGIGKLDFAGKAAGFLHLAEENGFTVIPIKTAHLTVLETLPLIHRDPFDRLLIATAIAEQMTLITNDKNIAQYEVSQIW